MPPLASRPETALILLVVAAVGLAGCTAPFPEASRILVEREVGDLGAGEEVRVDVPDIGDAAALMVGMRTSPSPGLEVVLEDATGQAWDTRRGDPAQPCAVRTTHPAPWTLVVRTDPFDGILPSGKFTVRALAELPGDLVPCLDQPYPGHGRTVTVGHASWNVTDAPDLSLDFEVAHSLDGLRLVLAAPPHVAAPSDGAGSPEDNGTEPEGTETSSEPVEVEVPPPPGPHDVRAVWHPPTGSPFLGATVGVAPEQGQWKLELHWPDDLAIPHGNVTIGVRGTVTAPAS